MANPVTASFPQTSRRPQRLEPCSPNLPASARPNLPTKITEKYPVIISRLAGRQLLEKSKR